MSLPEPSAEVLEAATIAAYDFFTRGTTGADGPEQMRLGRIAWEQTEKLPFVRQLWLGAVRAGLMAALAKATELAPDTPKPEPIDLAKNADVERVRCGVGMPKK